VLADGWYSWVVPEFTALTDVLAGLPRDTRRRILQTGWLRGCVLAALSVRHDVVAAFRTDTGWRSLLLARALFGRRRKLIAFHFIDHAPRRHGRGRWVDLAWRPIDRWATRRAVLAAQVLSGGEAELYAARFGVEVERFHFVPFAWRMSPAEGGDRAAGSDAERVGVIAAGRASCDWTTLFAAARQAAAAGTPWPLTVVCGEHDLDQVARLNARGLATVHVDIPHDAARGLLTRAAVSVLPMFDGELSHGHVRLCDSVEACTAVVASRVRSLDGYVEDGGSAILVPPEDAEALRAAVDGLLADPEQARRLAAAAFSRAARWTWDHYLRALAELAQVAARSGPAAPAAPAPPGGPGGPAGAGAGVPGVPRT
jgi:glycosyltransferase involved in cell wall biosynthesis